MRTYYSSSPSHGSLVPKESIHAKIYPVLSSLLQEPCTGDLTVPAPLKNYVVSKLQKDGRKESEWDRKVRVGQKVLERICEKEEKVGGRKGVKEEFEARKLGKRSKMWENWMKAVNKAYDDKCSKARDKQRVQMLKFDLKEAGKIKSNQNVQRALQGTKHLLIKRIENNTPIRKLMESISPERMNMKVTSMKAQI